jgi:hypothetical protein
MDFLGSLLTIFFLALLAILIISPFESLQWWAGWVADDTDAETPERPPLAPSDLGTQPDQYVIFLPGVGAMGTVVDPWEQSLVDRLQAGLHGGIILAGLFPFTVREDTLTEHRRTAWFWRWLAGVRERRPSLVAHLIDWRNLTQVFVSMDPRYGPIYNKGVEEKLAGVLHEQGYDVGGGVPITLIGYSGGAQIALGASLYLAHDFQASVKVISLGGVLGDDPALASVKHLYHLWGSKDLESRLATLVVPARWPISKRSRWNEAIAARRLSQRCLGEMVHTGPKGYLDMKTMAPDGRSYLEVTATAMLDIVDPNRARLPEQSVASVTDRQSSASASV